ncbi:MAG: ester cyclase, partial [Pseudomonadota bacterium]
MKYISLILTALTLMVTAAHADDRKVVEAFYTDLLSAPNSDDLADRVANVVVENWVSVPTPRGGPDADGLIKTLQGFGAAIPDLNWDVQEILQDGNRYIVRSIATGTPVKPLFGIEPAGNSFQIMTIDIHTVEDGKIVQSFHVEEWAKAMQQLAAE